MTRCCLLARYPCTLCGQRIEGDHCNSYLQLYRGSDEIRLNHRTHDTCQEELLGDWLSKADHKDARGLWCQPDPGETPESLWSPSTGSYANGFAKRGS
jgi:hypothetical protein